MSGNMFDSSKRQANDVLFREQRQDPRYMSELSVEFSITGDTVHTFYTGLAEDISTGGVFLATHQIYPIGSEITLNFDISGKKISLKAIVRWVKAAEIFDNTDIPPGVGLQFVNLSQGAKDVIDAFTKKREPMFVDVD